MEIRVTDIAYVRFEAPDLDVMEAFLSDFAMRRSQRTDDTLYMRGTDDEGFVHVTGLGPEPRFVGMAFNAAGEATRTLRTQCRRLPPVRSLVQGTVRTPHLR